MYPIETLVEPYIELESDIRKLIGSLFSDTCGMCTACCCRPDICEESIQSAFLSLLLERQGRSPADLDDRYGWLDTQGCSLEYGRPPVCYTFFCDELLARLPDEESRWMTRMLGRLIEYIGENAFKRWHLVEIETTDDLESVDVETLSERLAKARSAFKSIERYFESGHMEREERALLEEIGLPDS